MSLKGFREDLIAETPESERNKGDLVKMQGALSLLALTEGVNLKKNFSGAFFRNLERMEKISGICLMV